MLDVEVQPESPRGRRGRRQRLRVCGPSRPPTGEGGPVPPTGRSVESDYAHLMGFRGGRTTEARCRTGRTEMFFRVDSSFHSTGKRRKSRGPARLPHGPRKSKNPIPPIHSVVSYRADGPGCPHRTGFSVRININRSRSKLLFHPYRLRFLGTRLHSRVVSRLLGAKRVSRRGVIETACDGPSRPC